MAGASWGREMRIFLSYRRGDAAGYAGRLSDSLVQRLGSRSVFQDVTAINPGDDFTVAIDRALDESDAVLAVIGPDWLSAAGESGDSRLFEGDDYVRLELGRALGRDVPVIPVLVGGASLPAASELPPELQGLVHRQAIVVRDDAWHRDVDGLVRSLRGEPAVPPRRHGRWLLAGAVTSVVVVVGGLLWWRSGSGSSSSSDLPSCAPPDGPSWAPIALGPQPSTATPDPAGSLVFTVTQAKQRGGDGRWQVTLATTMENDTTDSAYHGDWRYEALIVGRREFPPSCFAPTPNLVSAGTIGDALVGFDVRCPPTGYMELVVDEGRLSVTDRALDPVAC